MPRYRLWLWWVAWWIVTLLRPLLFRLRVEGRDNVMAEGGAVMVSNHNYGFDFVYLGYSSPRELHFMAKAEMFGWNPILAWLLRSGAVFPVQRGKSDAAAIETAVQRVRAGNLLTMFPEGTRSKDGKLMRGKTGAARIALAANAPLIPAAVIGSPQLLKGFLWWRPQIIVRFGKPVYQENLTEDPDAARKFTDAAMFAIADLLPPDQRGVYADPAKRPNGQPQDQAQDLELAG
jgi:1-acyl-sn-glycerol-3-phosphate acyltransferase